ncbi:MAG: S-methyl-5'-thioadenosine phosphorylase [Elusimicrobiota bacterium]|jgi:5'-methylthioadenosine phosphorylase|nr:S-methyl-5'-thioadenosine phosphorylase [Elusimicrobiota bacterium]
MNKEEAVKIAFIGGSGLYEIEGFEDVVEKDIDTPFGKPSDKIIVGHIKGVRCAFLARHARSHVFTPAEINQRANMWALKSLGVEQIVAFTACGSLKDNYYPKDLVIPDQIFDRTKDRPGSFFSDGIVAHISAAHPFCEGLRNIIHKTVADAGLKHHFGGTYVCIEGNRFSTKAESLVNKSLGFSIVGMTAVPEAQLAREAEMCYANISLVTDFDSWKEGEEVTNDKVLEAAAVNISNSRKIIKDIVSKIAARTEDCGCRHSLAPSIMTAKDKAIQSPHYKKIALFVDKYFKK